MSIINAIILGLVQGVTEFIPVSSSGHLVIVSHLLNVGDAFTFDTLLNVGSLVALIVYYRKRIWSIITRTFMGKEWLLLIKIITATIPAVIFGVLLGSQIDALNNMVWVVTLTTLIIGILMILVGKANKNADDQEIEKSVNLKTSSKIGLAQAVALIPGISRSGITILTGLRCNLSAARSAEFSFLLAIPVIAGACAKMLLSSSGFSLLTHNLVAVIIGNIICFISGMLAINFLIKLISKRGLKDFGWYRVGLSILLVVLILTNILH
jgi:undecaprenyl-diphosphatase